jgi:DNA-directed RNA polymerase specialized sigma24 family protein
MHREKNVYTRRVALINGNTHYFISFIGTAGEKIEIEVGRDVFDEVQEQLREDMRQYRSDFTHTEHKDLDFEEIEKRSVINGPTTEDEVLNGELSYEIAQAILSLPVTQQRRFLQYHAGGLSEKEIALSEGCSQQAVSLAIRRAESTLKNLLKKKD